VKFGVDYKYKYYSAAVLCVFPVFGKFDYSLSYL